MPGDDAGAAPDAGTAWIERWFLRVALGIGVAAWLALVLAELGRLGSSLLLALLAAGAVALAAHARFVRPRPPSAPSPRVGRGGLVAFGAVTLLAGFLFLPPYETVVAEGDATVYLNLSREIARTGGLVFDDPPAAGDAGRGAGVPVPQPSAGRLRLRPLREVSRRIRDCGHRGAGRLDRVLAPVSGPRRPVPAGVAPGGALRRAAVRGAGRRRPVSRGRPPRRRPHRAPGRAARRGVAAAGVVREVPDTGDGRAVLRPGRGAGVARRAAGRPAVAGGGRRRVLRTGLFRQGRHDLPAVGRPRGVRRVAAARPAAGRRTVRRVPARCVRPRAAAQRGALRGVPVGLLPVRPAVAGSRPAPLAGVGGRPDRPAAGGGGARAARGPGGVAAPRRGGAPGDGGGCWSGSSPPMPPSTSREPPAAGRIRCSG